MALLASALLCAAVGCPAPALAQSAVAQGFASPPESAKPQTWWHWVSGNVTPEGITADLQAMKQIGLGGAQIFSVNQGPPGPVRYMSPQWRALVQHAISVAAKLHLHLSITDCEGWSESGGPWITPELSMQKVVWTVTTAEGGQSTPITLPRPEDYKGYYRDIAVLAYPTPAGGDAARITNVDAKAGFTSDAGAVTSSDPAMPAGTVIDPKSVVNLSAMFGANGALAWTPPSGSWTILRLGATSTGTFIHPAMPQTAGLECDKLSREAVTANWNGAMAHVIADSGPRAGTTLRTVLMDSWEAGTGNWTPLMREDFQTQRGYDPLLWLPALTGRVIGSTDQTERFLWDYRRTMADLLAANHYGLIRSLAHEHGMLLQAEAVGIGLPTVADELLCKANTDIPMGEFWIGNPGTLSDDKEAASAAHIYGKPYAAAESFTSVPEAASWTNDPYSLKALGDRAFCTGVNRMCFHRYAMQPYLHRWPGMTMGPWGLNFERTNTWWVPGKAWISYISRCQYLLQHGLFVGDICYFYGEGAPRDVGSFDFEPKPPSGYDYDVCNADVLLHKMRVRYGRIVLADGMSYRVLVLPNDSRLTPAVAAKVRDLVAAGATVIGPKPTSSPSLSEYPNCDEKVRTIGQQVWGDCDGVGISRHRFGLGQVIWGEPLEKILSGIGPDFSYSTQTRRAEIEYIHRAASDGDYYFVSNQQYRPVDAVCTFRVAGKAPEFWWPDTGRIERTAVYQALPGRTSVPIHFGPAGSMFVVFRNNQGGSPHIVSVKADHPIPWTPPPTPKVHIISAVYGVTAKMNVTSAIADWAKSGEPPLAVSNAIDGGDDPAPNIVKELDVDYTVAGVEQTAAIAEGSPLALPGVQSGATNVAILKATYGAPGGSVDATAEVAALVAAGANEATAGNDLVNGDPAPNIVKELDVTFTVDGVPHSKSVKEGNTLTLYEWDSTKPPVFDTAIGRDGKPVLMAWQPGPYTVEFSSGTIKTVTVPAVPAPLDVPGPWNLSFPAGWGAPAHMTLAKLASWTTLSDPGARYFSGTATYTTTFTVGADRLGPGKSLYLDLGIVKNLADVSVNGHDLGVLWKEPFGLEITQAAKLGANTLRIKVTNLWPNRLIGDQFLPPAKRYTWTTFNPYTKSSDLLDSGLIGPVTLHSAVWKLIVEE